MKRPEEVATLAKVYGKGFYLIGIFASEAERLEFLTDRKGLAPEEAKALIERDQKEGNIALGQRTRDTFQLTDMFVRVSNKQYEIGLRRFIELVLGNPFATPTRDEHRMFLAYSASLRSGDLSRQVGAALARAEGDVVALGCNDVPAPGGGLYWTDDGEKDQRDHVRKRDTNDTRKAEIVDDVIEAIRNAFLKHIPQEEFREAARPIVRKTLVSDVTEFGRSVHAEMDALISAARVGISVKGTTLYTTTFPCHTCARHIVAAGIHRVVYIEPYPKSLAPELHDDSICVSDPDESDSRIPFEPFVGIGPRRFFDLFSMNLGAGFPVERKQNGEMVDWNFRRDARPRVPMPPASYIELENMCNGIIKAVADEIKLKEEQENDEEARDEVKQPILGPGREKSSGSGKLAPLENGPQTGYKRS